MTGLRIGVFWASVYTVIVLIAIVTSVMASPMLKYAMSRITSTEENTSVGRYGVRERRMSFVESFAVRKKGRLADVIVVLAGKMWGSQRVAVCSSTCVPPLASTICCSRTGRCGRIQSMTGSTTIGATRTDARATPTEARTSVSQCAPR